MSKMRTKIITCEKCHKDFSIDVYDSVNVTLNPELKKKVMSGKIFEYTCPHCHKKQYSLYPLLYNDMDHKFMIKLDSIPSLMKYEEIAVKGISSKINDDFFGALSDVKHLGATCIQDLRSKVIMLENGLDYRIGTLYELLMLNKFNNFLKVKKEKDYIGIDCNFDYDKEGKLITLIEYQEEKEPHRIGCMPVDFDKNMYKRMEKDLTKNVDEVYNFFFDHNSGNKLMSIKEEDIEGYKQAIMEIAAIELANGRELLSFVPEFNECKYSIGDEVILMEHRILAKGKITKFYHMSRYSLPIDLDDMFVVAWKVKNIELTVTKNSDEILNNVALKENLSMHKKDFHFNRELFANADVIVPFTVKLKDSVDFDPSKIDIGDEVPADFIEPDMCVSNIKGFRYLHVYLNQDDCHKENMSKMIYNLDQLVDFLLNSPEEYQGIIINPETTKFKLDLGQLITYKGERILTSEDRMKKLLKSLTQEEINYMGKTSYDAICNAYFSNTTPKKIAEKMGITFEEVDKAFNTGYWCLKHIVWDNYIFDNKENTEESLVSA